MHHQSKFCPNQSMHCGDIVISRFFNMITIDYLVHRIPHFTDTSALTVCKFYLYLWLMSSIASQLQMPISYPFMVCISHVAPALCTCVWRLAMSFSRWNFVIPALRHEWLTLTLVSVLNPNTSPHPAIQAVKPSDLLKCTSMQNW